MIAARLPRNLIRRMERQRKNDGRTRTDYIRAALEREVARSDDIIPPTHARTPREETK
jgi:predicted DNA-binding protein